MHDLAAGGGGSALVVAEAARLPESGRPSELLRVPLRFPQAPGLVVAEVTRLPESVRPPELLRVPLRLPQAPAGASTESCQSSSLRQTCVTHGLPMACREKAPSAVLPLARSKMRTCHRPGSPLAGIGMVQCNTPFLTSRAAKSAWTPASPRSRCAPASRTRPHAGRSRTVRHLRGSWKSSPGPGLRGELRLRAAATPS